METYTEYLALKRQVSRQREGELSRLLSCSIFVLHDASNDVRLTTGTNNHWRLDLAVLSNPFDCLASQCQWLITSSSTTEIYPKILQRGSFVGFPLAVVVCCTHQPECVRTRCTRPKQQPRTSAVLLLLLGRNRNSPGEAFFCFSSSLAPLKDNISSEEEIKRGEPDQNTSPKMVF